MLTLTGPGGVGKTRLALQAVGDASDGFPDGIWWVPLASLRDPALLLSSVALALGVPEQPGRGLDETLVDVLSSGRAILLLDNLEQLLPGAAGPVATLRDAGGATLVVTSRERLRISGEQVYAVAPLAAAEAAELFSARTGALGADAGDAESVAELCSRLDNLPLAVELAAARAGLLAPAEIVSRLGGRLDRLRGDRDADPRQQTLRDTIAWSHDLLDLPEQELFARLAVFTGRVTLDAVEAVCDADLDELTSLLDKSLVRRTGERIWMLETIREFASEQLDANPGAEELRERHSAYYLALAEASDRALTGPGQTAALERLASERDDLRAAFEHLLEHDPSAALQLVAALWNFWFMRGHFQEGREMLLAALGRADTEPTEARASAPSGQDCSRSRRRQPRVDPPVRRRAGKRPNGRLDPHRDQCAQPRRGLHRARPGGADQPRRGGDRRRPRVRGPLAARARDREPRPGTEPTRGDPGRNRSDGGGVSPLPSDGRRVPDGALDQQPRRGRLATEDTGDARTKLAESLELARLIGDTRGIDIVTLNLGWVELLEGDFDRAGACFEEAAAIARRLGRRAYGADAICGFAQLAAAVGDADRAARLAGAASALGGPDGFDPTASVTLARYVDDARAALSEHAWQKAWADGAELGFDAAFSLALEGADSKSVLRGE